jgi:hypothetical protein
LTGVGAALARWLSEPLPIGVASRPTPPEKLRAALRPGDVLLVEGRSRISAAIKYLTQSTWSHSSLYVGPAQGLPRPDQCFVEADLVAGVRAVGIEDYAGYHTRICRPVGLSAQETATLIGFAVARLGYRYDLKNVIDLARYLLPTPPVPTRWRRRMIALGSGDPTRAICSTLIAEAFETIRYPILPLVETDQAATREGAASVAEQMHIRHHSLFTPRDFDASPYFEIVKPTLADGFDFHKLSWAMELTEVGAKTPSEP